MKSFSKSITLVGLSLICLSVAIQSTKAATIAWDSPVTISGVSDVLTEGTLHAATSFFENPVTVNGVTFGSFSGTSTGDIGLQITGGQAQFNALTAPGAFTALPAEYQTLLREITYTFNALSPSTVTISGLTSGVDYSIQYWVNDPRVSPQDFSARTQTVGTQTLDVNTTGLQGGLGQWVVGTFTADGATQTFSTQGSTTAIEGATSTYFQAMQVRAVPEPSTIAMMIGAVGSIALWKMRRSKKGGASAST